MQSDDQFYRAVRMVAPGTRLYEGLENILRARTGALVVVSDSESVMNLTDGGFRINADMEPANLYELAKMDGAIVLSSDAKKIILANAHLNPDPMIPTGETGTRHRTAERVAVQTGELVISISQRRNVITLYQGNNRYVMREIGTILAKANQAVQTLQKYKSVLEQALINLSALEFEDLVTLEDVCTVIQRAEMVARIAGEIVHYIYELGTEGRLVSMQLEELMADVEDEGLLVLRDYIPDQDNLEEVRSLLTNWSYEELLDMTGILRLIGYTGTNFTLESSATSRGYRILKKIPRLPLPVIDNLVKNFGDLQQILEATTEELDEVEGIGEVRARSIKEGLRRLREQVLLDRHI